MTTIAATSALRYRLQAGRAMLTPGGGVAYFRCQRALDAPSATLEGDIKIGVQIIRRAIEQPLRTLCDNAGVEGSVVVEAVKKENKNMGYNVDTEEMVDMFEAGVIDPTKVARSALQNAASVASLLLTTEALITERRGQEEGSGSGPAGIRPGRLRGVSPQRCSDEPPFLEKPRRGVFDWRVPFVTSPATDS